MSAKTLALIEEHDVKWVDLRFTDTRGKEQHVTHYFCYILVHKRFFRRFRIACCAVMRHQEAFEAIF